MNAWQARGLAALGSGEFEEAYQQVAAVSPAGTFASHMLPGAGRWPFALARVQLADDERLRRAQATTGSRLHLTAALETFERLGARPWAGRATAELRATGLGRPRVRGKATFH
jgi:hypothetical protein